jgi:hypothetical protein
VAQPASDHIDLNAGFDEMDGTGVPKDVWADSPAGMRGVEVRCVSTDDLVDAEAGERVPASREYRALRGGRGIRGADQRTEQLGRLHPQRTGPLFVTFTVEADQRMLAEIEVLDTQIGNLLHASPGVV